MMGAACATGGGEVPVHRDWVPDVVVHTSSGLAVVDRDGTFLAANPAAVRLCGLAASAVAGAPSPFRPRERRPAAGTELVADWQAGPGQRREFSYVLDRVPGQDRWVVSFRDVTAARLHERRLAAIATAASNVASRRSLTSTLEALTQEVARTDGLAGVQILTLNAARDRLQVMGAAGFDRDPLFFDKLLACRARGAHLMMMSALDTGGPVVAQQRYEQVMSDPAWEPLQDVLRTPRWDSFASVPMIARGEPVGVLNAFFSPGQSVGATEVDFLEAMAGQAAMAVQQAAVLEREGEVARQEERQRLARHLHDSVVQQVFSMMMQATSLGVLVQRGLPPAPEKVAQVAGELASVAEDVLADLRGMVVELRPVSAEGQGLCAAMRSLCRTTSARTEVAVTLDLDVPPGAAEQASEEAFDRLDPDLVEDVYRVVAEAVHNSVKHASPSTIGIAVRIVPDGPRRRLRAEVTDDGRGLTGARAGDGAASGGFGITAMRARAEKWGGSLTVEATAPVGTRVLLDVPLPATVPAEPAPGWVVTR
jgi:signal transduction histidine kinase